jgi:hypothetical protein
LQGCSDRVAPAFFGSSGIGKASFQAVWLSPRGKSASAVLTIACAGSGVGSAFAAAEGAAGEHQKKCLECGAIAGF